MTPPDPLNQRPPPAAGALPQPPALALARGQLLLIYTPDGPVGGTFTCVACAAQAWQPELLHHAAGCLQGQPRLPPAPA